MWIKDIRDYILYEDKDILVCHKPAGLAVQNARVGSMDMESLLKNYIAQKVGGGGGGRGGGGGGGRGGGLSIAWISRWRGFLYLP